MKNCSHAAIFLAAIAGCGASSGSAPNGSACGSNAECASEFCVPWADGYCSQDCAEMPCGEGETCRAVAGARVCVRNCGARDECRTGYMCFQGVCQPSCLADAECGMGFSCSDGQCTPLPGAAIGEKCSKGLDCSSRLCDAATKSCQLACASEGECGPSGTCFINPIDKNGDGNSDDIQPICVPRRGGKALLAPCVKSSDCDQGQCLVGTCVALCQSAGQCAAKPAQTCATMYAQLDYGNPKLTACVPKIGRFLYDLPDGRDGILGLPSTAVAFSIFVEAGGQDTSYYTGVSNLIDPSGSQLINQGGLRYTFSEGTSMLLMSNSPVQAPFSVGIYTFSTHQQLGMRGPPLAARTRIRIKLSDTGLQTSGRIPLHVFITNLSGSCVSQLKAATAKTTLAPFEKELRRLFAQVNLIPDPITYADSTAPNTFSHDGGGDLELANLLKRATAGDTPDALELVIVKRILGGGGGDLEVLGVAGGIPASVGIPGTPHSGATASLTSLCMDKTQKVFASTVAHELGHTLGLFHNVESNGATDNLTDNDGDKENNLMYWVESRQTANRLSPQQGRVILANPAIEP